MTWMRYTVLGVVLLLVLGWINGLIVHQERVVAQGQTIFLELAPRDPRSLMQGDFMALNYRGMPRDLPTQGYLVVRVDARNVASFVGASETLPDVGHDELRLRYRRHENTADFGGRTFFFQEGHAEYYEEAEFAELRVDGLGNAVLVGLRGPNLEPLGPP